MGAKNKSKKYHVTEASGIVELNIKKSYWLFNSNKIAKIDSNKN